MSDETLIRNFFYASLVHLSLQVTLPRLKEPFIFNSATWSFLSFLNGSVLIVWGTHESTIASSRPQLFVLGLAILFVWFIKLLAFASSPDSTEPSQRPKLETKPKTKSVEAAHPTVLKNDN
ncbi:hypothetical protein FSARC_9565 [Fusarium sarcochroum]|uniref:Uncharacterized protein n=1 Tax=Fusarium sarcochroum TaxID=1208366 RepID=A0A8H4X564_9HYPO|nr:hypothetical protein FSARC_9565 [Fusarium sarcochroum]